MSDDSDFSQVSKMYKQRLESELSGNSSASDQEKLEKEVNTREYEEFKQQYIPKHLSIYEKICQTAEKTLNIQPDKGKQKSYEDAIRTCHLNTTATGVYSASILIPLLLILVSMIMFFMMPVMMGGEGNMFFVIVSVVGGLAIMIALQGLPSTLANQWRMRASNQMVLSIFYIVTYMRHTSNLELAINFASEHLNPPLSLDLRKVVWDVETGKYESIKVSLDDYLERWRKWNQEFVESMNLIQSSLLESVNERRLGSLDKALNVMLDETYEKMLHYAHNLKGPLTTLNMLGVVLPILTLVILPLVVSFMEGFRWYHLFVIYNIALPAMVYYLGTKILSTRPGGSGGEDITEKNPELKKYQKIPLNLGGQKLYLNPASLAALFAIVLFLIGIFPLAFHAINPQTDFGIVQTETGPQFKNLQYDDESDVLYYFLDYRERSEEGHEGEMVGPFGMGAVLLGILIPLGIGYSMGLYYKLRSRKIIKVRNQSKKLELEFSSALFQLGNRIGDGIPAEMSFGKVSAMMEGTTSGKFFHLAHMNITRLGMNVEKAIFDPEKGALKFYPSDLIESSMKVLVESTKKGPRVASQALINVSEYIKQMHRVDERLDDLMGDVISSMKSQVKFLTPVISGVVIGITSMITKILGKLGNKLGELGSGAAGAGVAGGGMLQMFGTGIPTYPFQIVVGLYVVELSFILSVIANGIENGPDRIQKEHLLGQNMTKATGLYCTLAFIIILLFNIVAGNIIGNLA
ncbi:MAG: hypothetical protein ACLFNB_01945 [Candidatus Woesearchaeota archaeon]